MRTFQNPILPGFYPDPSVCRVGEDFYLVTSTFAYFPGVPIFHSRDLVHWTQIGNVLTRPSQLPLDNADVSRGIFAPTIRYHDGVFYMITTNVSGGGNFLVTATDPAGEWSEPHWLRGADGIDPSLFFEDGKCWYHGTREKENGAYYGDNDIYLQELDLEKMELVGERHIIWHCALKNAVWPEGPHIYKKNGWYYLLISEGGTAHEHAITVARSRTLTGYYDGNKSNPILTHRHLGRDFPIVNVGHGDFVETPGGEWWVVLLASRPYGGRFRNLGRETFLAPVSWEDDWPVINYGVGQVRETERFPDLPVCEKSDPQSFDFREVREIPKNLLHLRNPAPEHYDFSENPRGLRLRLNKNSITELGTVSFLCIRQQHKSFDVTAQLHFAPKSENEAAGLVILQNRAFNYQFVLSKKNDANILRVIKCESEDLQNLAEMPLPASESSIFFKIVAREQEISFLYSIDGKVFTLIFERASAKFLNTDTAGGFVGNTIGMYASSNGADSDNHAIFSEFSYEGVN